MADVQFRSDRIVADVVIAGQEAERHVEPCERVHCVAQLHGIRSAVDGDVAEMDHQIRTRPLDPGAHDPPVVETDRRPCGEMRVGDVLSDRMRRWEERQPDGT